MKCIVCKSEDLVVKFIHRYWKKPFHTCNNCDHSHLYDYDNVDTRDYNSNKNRSKKYLNMLNGISVDSVLEIGPSIDFWFSKQFIKSSPKVNYSTFDVVDNIPPEPIKRVENLKGDFDLASLDQNQQSCHRKRTRKSYRLGCIHRLPIFLLIQT